MLKVEKILFPVEFSGASEKALFRVEGTARLFGAKVILLHVIPETPIFLLASPNTEKYIEFIKQRAMERLNDYVTMFEQRGIEAVAEIADGKVYLQIVDAARKFNVDIVMMTRKGEYGSTVLKVVRRSSFPVYVIKDEEPSPIKTIMFPTDLSAPAGFGWRYAVEIARRLSAKLVVFHVHEVSMHWSELESELQVYYPEFAEFSGETIRKKLIDQLSSIYRAEDVDVAYDVSIAPDASLEIADKARQYNIDLIIMTTHGRSGLKRILLGSVTEKTLRLAPSDMLIIRPPEFNSSQR